MKAAGREPSGSGWCEYRSAWEGGTGRCTPWRFYLKTDVCLRLMGWLKRRISCWIVLGGHMLEAEAGLGGGDGALLGAVQRLAPSPPAPLPLRGRGVVLCFLRVLGLSAQAF